MHSTNTAPKIGISACLLGREVRFDGGHTRDRFVTDVLAEHVDFVPMCPELESGMGSPRPSIHQERRADGALRVLTQKRDVDVTSILDAAISKRIDLLRVEARSNLAGFILKKDSPSCGPYRIRVRSEDGSVDRSGEGRLVTALRAEFPHLPIEDEGRLNDAGLRESFLIRVFAWHRWQTLVTAPGGRCGSDGLTRRALREFHAAHKMLLHAHGPAATKALGRLVANPSTESAAVAADAESYVASFMAILAQPASRGRHVDTLQHLSGHVADHLRRDEKTELHGLIHEYQNGWVTLETPMALLRHHLRSLGSAWANAQLYLDPHPRALALRSVIR